MRYLTVSRPVILVVFSLAPVARMKFEEVIFLSLIAMV